jgi:hypothetical protein
LGDDRMRYVAMGAAAARHTAKEFDIDVQTRKLESIYTEAMND